MNEETIQHLLKELEEATAIETLARASNLPIPPEHDSAEIRLKLKELGMTDHEINNYWRLPKAE